MDCYGVHIRLPHFIKLSATRSVAMQSLRVWMGGSGIHYSLKI